MPRLSHQGVDILRARQPSRTENDQLRQDASLCHSRAWLPREETRFLFPLFLTTASQTGWGGQVRQEIEGFNEHRVPPLQRQSALANTIFDLVPLPLIAVRRGGCRRARCSAAHCLVTKNPLTYRIVVLVEVEHLAKRFGMFTAVDDVSFVVMPGEIVGLIGPNGAGKTTIVHTILGLIAPSAGRIRLFGGSLEQDRAGILQRLNFTSPYVGFPPRLTVRENLTIFARLYGIRDAARTMNGLMQRFAIDHLAGKTIARLSSGEITRVALCKAFLNNPELLLLDEPSAYLDPQGAIQVRETLLGLQKDCGTTILYTSHNIREVQRLCSRIIFLREGRIIESGTPIEVTRKILNEDRDTPALEEVFMRVANS
jgi:ABC-2 type transport system ATP-binding protein